MNINMIFISILDSEDDIYDEKLIHPLARKISNWLPGKKRRYLNSQATPNSTTTTTTTTIIPTVSEKTEKIQKFVPGTGPA